MYSDMSSRTIACSSSNRNSARARASSVLPTPVGPTKRNDPIGEAGAGPANSVGDGLDRLVLSDHPHVETVLHFAELLGLALDHPVDRHARPLRHDRGDILLRDLFAEHRLTLLQVRQAGV